ncbi:MAG: STAUR_1299 family protein [Thermodesulfobacteriota bacterium]
MAAYIDLLLGRAFESMPGELYNRYRERQQRDGSPPLLHYEVPLMEQRPWEYLRDVVYPSLARYLRDKSLDPETAKGVVVAIFHGTRCYLLRGEDFVEVFREMEGLNPTAYHFRVLRWLKQ